MVRDERESVAVPAVDGGVERFAQPGRALRDGVEHGLDVGWRARDGSQDLGGGGLLLEGLGEIAVARLDLGEQAHVLDRDHGLIGEGLEQGKVAVRERIHLGAPKVDRAHGRPLP